MTKRTVSAYKKWKSWPDLPPKFQCALIWAHTWWGPSEYEDFTRLAAFLEHGELGPLAVVMNEDLRWMAHGLRFAFPDESWEACYKAVSIFRNTTPSHVRNRAKGTDSSWKVIKKWASAVVKETPVSIELVLSSRLAKHLQALNPISREDRLRMVPPGCPSEIKGFWTRPCGSWCMTGAPIIFGPWRIFKTWIPYAALITSSIDGQAFTTTDPNHIIDLRTGVEWGLDASLDSPFHSIGFRDLPSPPEITKYLDLDSLHWEIWRDHLSARLGLNGASPFLPPPPGMPRLRTEA